MKKFLENFWYYHKWKLLVAAMVVMVVVNTVSELTSAERLEHSVAIVTMDTVPEQVCSELSQGFSGIFPDMDQDGQVSVQINVYHYSLNQDITPTTLTEDDAVHLAADIRVGMSQIFLTNEPQVFADSGFIAHGRCADHPSLAFLPERFLEYEIFTPDPVADFVMEALD